MLPNRVTLLDETDPGVGGGAGLPKRSARFNPASGRRTYSADAKNTAGGAKNVTVDFYGSNAANPDVATEYDWVKIGTVGLVTDGANRITNGFQSDDTWAHTKAVISAADAAATLQVRAYMSSANA